MDVGGTVAREEHHGIRHLRELAGAPERRSLRAGIAFAQIVYRDAARIGKRFLIGEGAEACCLHDARSHAHDAHIVLAEFLRPGACEGIDRIFGRRVNALPFGAFQSAFGGHIDDDTLSVLHELMPQSLRHEINTLDIHARHLVVNAFVQLILAVGILRVHQQTGNVDARIVHEDVQLAELLLCLLYHGLHIACIRHVRHHIEHFAAALVRLEFRLLGVHVADHHIRAIVQKCLGHRLADAGRAARHNRCFSFQTKP